MRVRQICSLVILMLLTSCASSINLSKSEQLRDDEGIVFGSVEVIQETENIMSRGNLVLVADNSSSGETFKFFGDGWNLGLVGNTRKDIGHNRPFFWHLPARGYTITRYELSYTNRWTEGGSIMANFKSLRNTAVYIGKLTINISDSGTHFIMEDEYEVALHNLREKFPTLKVEVTKNLMTLEKRR